MTYDPGDIRQWRAHVCSSLSRCALHAARTAAVNSWLAAAMSPRAAAPYGLQSISCTAARRRVAAVYTAGVNQLLVMPVTIVRLPSANIALPVSMSTMRKPSGQPRLATRLRSLEIERGMRTGPHGKLIRIPLLLLM